MGAALKNMSKATIQKFCERFLPVDFPGSSPLIELGVFAAGLSVLSPPAHLIRKRANFHSLLYSNNNAGAIQVESSYVSVRQNSLWLIPAGLDYALKPASKSWQVMWFHIRRSQRWSHLERSVPLARPPGQAHRMVHVLTSLIAESRAPQHDRVKMGKCLSEVLCIFLQRRLHLDAGFAEARERERIAEVWEKVDHDLKREWTVADVAEIHGSSVSHFHRLTQRFHHTSPLKVITQLRVQRARELLANTDLKLESIATVVGYESGFSLSKVFKTYTGIPPREFRRRLKA
jgi:AraC-like DNA-binding protein